MTSKLDFCNSLLHEIPAKDVKKMQRVLNCLARVAGSIIGLSLFGEGKMSGSWMRLHNNQDDRHLLRNKQDGRCLLPNNQDVRHLLRNNLINLYLKSCRPAWKVRDRGFEPRSSIQVSKKPNVSSLLTRKYPIVWGLGPRGSELGIRPPGFEFRILCLEGSVILFNSVGSPSLA